MLKIWISSDKDVEEDAIRQVQRTIRSVGHPLVESIEHAHFQTGCYVCGSKFWTTLAIDSDECNSCLADKKIKEEEERLVKDAERRLVEARIEALKTGAQEPVEV